MKMFLIKIVEKIRYVLDIKTLLNSINKLHNCVNKLYILQKCSLRINSGIEFKSQSDQDVIALAYFNNKKDGFFIDIGAFDGVSISNTYALEQLGWSGACIEPLPDQFNNLQKNRKCDLYNVALCDKDDSDMEFISADGYSGFEDTMTNGNKLLVNTDKNSKKIYVKTMTFNRLMQNYPNRTHVNYMSIDVEGGELAILKTINFTKYTFDMITVENNRKPEVDNYMNKKGYHVLFDIGVDSIYVKNGDRTEMHYWNI